MGFSKGAMNSHNIYEGIWPVNRCAAKNYPILPTANNPCFVITGLVPVIHGAEGAAQFRL